MQEKNQSPSAKLFEILEERSAGEVREVVVVLHAYVLMLEGQLCEQKQRIGQLEARVKELEAQLSKDSSNSSKPPSSDGLKKPQRTQSLRDKSALKPGGQNGHAGKTLKFSDTPDNVIPVPRKKQCECGELLCNAPIVDDERRQVVDLPPVKPVITEYRGSVVQCPCCQRRQSPEFPQTISPGVSYGAGVKAAAIYLMNHHLIPYDRTAELFEDLFGIPLSAGTLCSFQEAAHASLESEEQAIKEDIVKSDVVCFDETGIRCEGKLHWCHTASTESSTFYAVHPKRGGKAMNDIGILPRFTGVAVHDHWAAYFDFDCPHALCNAHHLRELKFLSECEKEPWAVEMIEYLRKVSRAVTEAKSRSLSSFPEIELRQFSEQYEAILTKGINYHRNLPAFGPQPKAKGRGRIKQRPGMNLLIRLRKKKEEVLRFMTNFNVPFTNNLGERDLRMQKVKQKISGCHRTFTGAQMFCRIRGFISTVRKRGLATLDSLSKIMNKSQIVSSA